VISRGIEASGLLTKICWILVMFVSCVTLGLI
jgi:hypothetical protein